MNESDIENALKSRLGNNLSGLPSNFTVAWPNQDHDGARPYLDVVFSGGQRSGGALKGGASILRSRGVLAITVYVEENVSTSTANGYAETVAALFPEGLSIAITGGFVLILKPADVRKGFKGDAGWGIPVIVNYEATAT